MDRGRSLSSWRASALAVALFAITLNFLQPLAHAALMRDGPASALWNVFCSAAVADPQGDSASDKNSKPATMGEHGCCLGLAHTVVFAAPTTAFVLLPPVNVAEAPLPATDTPAAVGIRDGPGQPRGPPFLA
jgi:hypothetical protein